MIANSTVLIQDFVSAAGDLLGEQQDPSVISHHLLLAPHEPPALPVGKCAVYVFSLTQSAQCNAGPNRVLKVGRVGCNSGPRFQYQHYRKGSANSTVAGAIENNRLLWKYLGIEPTVTDFGAWLRANTDRDHFFVHESHGGLVGLLEVYVKAALGPVFEGSLKEHVVKVPAV